MKMWVNIERVEESEFNDSKIAYFKIAEREKHVVVSKNVLHYLKIHGIRANDKIFVILSKRSGKYIYLAKKYMRGNIESE